jgi:hypothetical protein
VTDELRIDRVIDAPPDVVFDTFIADDGRLAFYGQDDPSWVVESDCDLRVGGVWTITFGPSRTHLYRHRHIFEVSERRSSQKPPPLTGHFIGGSYGTRDNERPLTGDDPQAQRLQGGPLGDGQLDECFHVEKL